MLFVWGRKPEEMRDHRRAAAGPTDDVCAAGRLLDLRLLAGPRWPGWAIASPPPQAPPLRRWSRRCGGSYEALAQDRLDPSSARAAPSAREGRPPGHRSRPAPGDRAADHEGGVRTLGSPRSLILRSRRREATTAPRRMNGPGPPRLQTRPSDAPQAEAGRWLPALIRRPISRTLRPPKGRAAQETAMHATAPKANRQADLLAERADRFQRRDPDRRRGVRRGVRRRLGVRQPASSSASTASISCRLCSSSAASP